MNTTLYHVTSRANAMAILKDGFEGGWGDAGFGTYLFDCEQTAQDYLADGGWDGELPDDAVIIEVEAPDSEFEAVIPDPAWPNPEDYERVRWVAMDEDDEGARWKPLRMIPEETGEFILEVSVAKLREIADPTKWSPWIMCGQRPEPIQPEAVRTAIANGHLYEMPASGAAASNIDVHIERIAYLVVNGWDDACWLEFYGEGHWPVSDGNHRFYAAIMREDETILAQAVGDWEDIKRMRPDPTPLHSAPVPAI